MYSHMMRTPCQPSVAANNEFSRKKVIQLIEASFVEVSVKQRKVSNLSSDSQRLGIAVDLRVVNEAHSPFCTLFNIRNECLGADPHTWEQYSKAGRICALYRSNS
ncbi:hypothetical protein HHI36_007953 [Cryptolaemus montrouzieri]|uniref:Uncharacterized protein n=1 Tax=Cryptolaemus montrouzieri TaxID=559131 RepID=A0ABD2MRJ6_9CUCU